MLGPRTMLVASLAVATLSLYGANAQTADSSAAGASTVSSGKVDRHARSRLCSKRSGQLAT